MQLLQIFPDVQVNSFTHRFASWTGAASGMEDQVTYSTLLRPMLAVPGAETVVAIYSLVTPQCLILFFADGPISNWDLYANAVCLSYFESVGASLPSSVTTRVKDQMRPSRLGFYEYALGSIAVGSMTSLSYALFKIGS